MSPRHLGTMQRPTGGPLDALMESAVRWSVFGTAASPGLVGIVASAVFVGCVILQSRCGRVCGEFWQLLAPFDDLGCVNTCVVLFLEKKQYNSVSAQCQEQDC